MSALLATACFKARRTGLAPHYLTLYSCAVGLGAQRVFEFGAGESTAVLLTALQETGGRLDSVSPDVPAEERADPSARWQHHRCLSAALYPALAALGPFDLVLHDGSHSADVVAADLTAILPHVKQHGLVLVHDSYHSYVGSAVREGIDRGVFLSGALCERATLPFGFGLTILVVLNNPHLGQVAVQAADKPTSPHHTLIPGPV